jgi:hypothetical protein
MNSYGLHTQGLNVLWGKQTNCTHSVLIRQQDRASRQEDVYTMPPSAQGWCTALHTHEPGVSMILDHVFTCRAACHWHKLELLNILGASRFICTVVTAQKWVCSNTLADKTGCLMRQVRVSRRKQNGYTLLRDAAGYDAYLISIIMCSTWVCCAMPFARGLGCDLLSFALISPSLILFAIAGPAGGCPLCRCYTRTQQVD